MFAKQRFELVFISPRCFIPQHATRYASDKSKFETIIFPEKFVYFDCPLARTFEF